MTYRHITTRYVMSRIHTSQHVMSLYSTACLNMTCHIYVYYIIDVMYLHYIIFDTLRKKNILITSHHNTSHFLIHHFLVGIYFSAPFP